MKRRKFIIGCSSLTTIGLAGCTDPEVPPPEETPIDDPNNTSNPSGTPMQQPEKNVTVTEYTFELKEDAPLEHTIQRAEDGEIVIEGQVPVSNGCLTIQMSEEPKMSDSNPVTISAHIGTKDMGGDVCTTAVEYRGYQLTILTTGDAVEEVMLTQDGVDPKATTLTV